MAITRPLAIRCMQGCLLGVVFASSVAWTQETLGGGNTLHVKTQLVVLDVNITDSKGAQVTDLTKADFELYENGVKQTIRSFEPPASHVLPPQLATGKDITLQDLQKLAPDAPVTLLVMDELNSQFQDSAFTRTSIKRYLNAQGEVLGQPTALFAVTEATLQQVHGFTLSRSMLLDAMEHHKPVYPFQMMRTANSSEGTAERFAESLATLQQVAQAMSGFHGRKNIVWIGPGFPSIDMRNLPETQRKLIQGVSERTVNMLDEAHVTLYTVNPTISSSSATDFTQTIDDQNLSEVHAAKNPFDGTVSFNTFAPETGGRSFSLGNDLDHEIGLSVQEGTSFYTLSYSPATEIVGSKEEYRKLTIRLSRPGLHATTRQGFFSAPPPRPQLSPQKNMKELSYALGEAATSKIGYTAIALLAAPAERAGTFRLQVDTSAMSWRVDDKGTQSSDLLLLAVALDKNDKPLAKSASNVIAHLPGDRALSSVPFATLETQIAVPPAAVRLRFLVRDQTSGRIGSADLTPNSPR
jgi:VWFA-related protein